MPNPRQKLPAGKEKRSSDVMVASFNLWAASFLGILFPILALASGQMTQTILIASIFTVLLGIAAAIVGWGLWTMQSWASFAFFIICGFIMILLVIVAITFPYGGCWVWVIILLAGAGFIDLSFRLWRVFHQ